MRGLTFERFAFCVCSAAAARRRGRPPRPMRPGRRSTRPASTVGCACHSPKASENGTALAMYDARTPRWSRAGRTGRSRSRWPRSPGRRATRRSTACPPRPSVRHRDDHVERDRRQHDERHPPQPHLQADDQEDDRERVERGGRRRARRVARAHTPGPRAARRVRASAAAPSGRALRAAGWRGAPSAAARARTPGRSSRRGRRAGR